jgi:hypothetical protein
MRREKVKTTAFILKTALLLIVVVLFAACSGGLFNDPGHSSGGGSGGGGGAIKPAKLSHGASKDDALAKCDEIIDYCNAHPGMMNDMAKSAMETMKTIIPPMTAGQWSMFGDDQIDTINTAIDSLT